MNRRKPAAPVDCPARWATPRTPSRPTLGAAATRIAEQLNSPLMPWQQQVLDVALEVDPATRRYAYRDVTLTVPRQQGKTSLLLVLILTRALSAPRQQIRYTAQTGSDARKKWNDDWLPVLKPSKFASQFHVRLTNGNEALLFRNGSVQGLLSVTRKTGHGGSIDLGILDEAFAHPDARLEQALKPAMVTRPQPQLWVVSTAGTAEESPYLWGKVETGRQLVDAGTRTGLAYFEWSAADDADVSDPATWRSCMPALGRTITEEAVAADIASMSISEARRAYCNQWVVNSTDPVIPLDTWNALADRASQPLDPVTFAFDVSPDRSSAAIAAAGRRSDGRTHVEIVDHRSGTGWLAPRLAEIVRSHATSGVLCDPKSPAGSFIPALAAAGVEVTEVGARDHSHACGTLYDATLNGTLRHLGTPEMGAALAGASKRVLGDAWAWSRSHSSVDISPLVAATLAHWGAASREDRSAPQVWSLDAAAERILARRRAERQAAIAKIRADAGAPAEGANVPTTPTSDQPVTVRPDGARFIRF